MNCSRDLISTTSHTVFDSGSFTWIGKKCSTNFYSSFSQPLLVDKTFVRYFFLPFSHAIICYLQLYLHTQNGFRSQATTMPWTLNNHDGSLINVSERDANISISFTGVIMYFFVRVNRAWITHYSRLNEFNFNVYVCTRSRLLMK